MNIERILRWSTIMTSIILFFFWGSFFVDHLNEWYIQPSGYPPMYVTMSMLAHGLLLISYIIILWKPKIGAILIAFAAILYFMPLLGFSGIIFTLVALTPSILFLVKTLLTKHRLDRIS